MPVSRCKKIDQQKKNQLVLHIPDLVAYVVSAIMHFNDSMCDFLKGRALGNKSAGADFQHLIGIGRLVVNRYSDDFH